MIVTAGVFIGIKVSNWNQARIDRDLEREYIERLYDDAVQSATDQSENSAWIAESIDRQRLVLRALKSGLLSEEDRADIEEGLLLLGYIGDPALFLTAANELQSTGNMKLNRDIDLRDLIGRTQATYESWLYWSQNFSNRVFDLRATIDDHFEVIDADEMSPDSIALQYDFQSLSFNPRFVNTVSQILYLSRFQEYQSAQLSETTERLRDGLAVRLGLELSSVAEQ